MKTIAAAFVKAKRAFGPALKDKTNPAFRSKYADLGACIDAVEGALLDNGIAAIQRTYEDATGVTVETMFLHESGETLECGRLHVPAAKQDPQGYGSALTYARRYSLMTACGIAPEDDDGNTATKAVREAPKRKGVMEAVLGDMPPADPSEQEFIAELAENAKDLYAAKGIKTAYDRIEAGGLDSDQKVRLWALLPSDLRSALKRDGESRRVTS